MFHSIALILAVTSFTQSVPAVRIPSTNPTHTIYVDAAAAPSATPIISATDPRLAPPTDLSSAAADALFLLQLKKMGAWAAFALALSQLLIFALKQLEQTNTHMKKWGTLTVLVLSSAAAILSSIVGGLSWPNALVIFLSTSAPKVLHDFMTEAGWVKDDAPAAAAPPKV